MKKFLLLLGIALLFSDVPMVAQEMYPDSLTYKIGVDLTGMRNTGVFSRTTLRVGSQVQMKQKRWEFNNELSYFYNKTNDIQLLDNWLDVASLQYHLGGKWNWFPIALYQYETNLIYRVKNRNRFGLGIGAYPIDKNGYQVRFTTGYFFENENYNGDKFVNSELINSNRRNSSAWIHLENKIPIAKRGEFTLDIWYFRSFEESADYSIWILPNLKMKINEHLSFLIRYDWRFENVYLEPLTDVNDLFLFGLNIAFKN